MSMDQIFKSFKENIGESESPVLAELESRQGFRTYKITIFLKIEKQANIDISQVFNKVRAIPGVVTVKQEHSVQNRGSYWLSELTIKYNSRGIPNKSYIYNILVKQINNESEINGIPGTKVFGINWQSFKEV